MAKGLLPDDHPQCAAAARSFVLGQADVVVLIGARLNWLLGHGKPPQWSPNVRFVQVDISPTEIDSNRPIAAPVVADIGSAMSAFLAMLKPGQIKVQSAWTKGIADRKQHNIEGMAARLNANPNPMNFSSALRAIRDTLARNKGVYVVNEGANTLDFARNIIDMYEPRKRLDTGTWGNDREFDRAVFGLLRLAKAVWSSYRLTVAINLSSYRLQYINKCQDIA